MARKLSVSQAEIVRYLSSQNLEVEEGSNVKLGEAHIRSLYSRYAPEENYVPAEKTESRRDNEQTVVVGEDSLQLPEQRKETSTQTSHIATEATAPIQAEAAPPIDSTVAPLLTEADPTVPLVSEQRDTIRAPKVELAGLKVLGKIDLPETKKKETVTDEAAKPEGSASEENQSPSEESKPRTDRREEGSSRSRGDRRNPDDRRRSRSNQTREQRSYQNPIAAQREREIEAERERLKKKAAEDKERRTQNYEKRVKHSPPTKAARIIEEPVEELDTEALNARPTSWFGKFVQWLKS